MEIRSYNAIPTCQVRSFGDPRNPSSRKLGRNFVYGIRTGADSGTGDSDGMLTKEGGERKRKEQDGYVAGTVGTVRKWAFRSAINCYGAIDHSHSSEVEFTQWRPLEKVTSVTLSLVRPGSLNPTSISAFFHLPGEATDAIGDLFELSTMLWPIAPCCR
jgi:hypothetical protein